MRAIVDMHLLSLILCIFQLRSFDYFPTGFERTLRLLEIFPMNKFIFNYHHVSAVNVAHICISA